MSKSVFNLFLIFSFQTLLAQVSKRDTIIEWNTYEYVLDEYFSISSYSTSNTVTQTFDGIVLENELVKLCLVPQFGGRVISFIYKPTGHEQFYQNELGVPYLIDQNIFYHDWLMIYGGVFPTFPEPEHGKYWNMPWNVDVVTESEEKITISMWLEDTLDNPQKPGQYNNGVTGVTCYFDVTLESGKPTFDIDVTLENDETTDSFEYWTCVSFAPGSESGNTFTPGNSEMIVPIDEYQVGWNPTGWMQQIDEVTVTSPRVQSFENLAMLNNWEEQGIAYAYPILEEHYYGVINHENEEGLFRISNDQTKTPGMKFWTWGDEQGLAADVNDFYDYARPMIELWSGISQEFFEDATFSANETITWKETYMATKGMPNISFIDGEIGFYHEADESGINMFAFLPVASDTYRIVHTLSAEDEAPIMNEFTIPSATDETSTFELVFSELNLSDGNYTSTVELLQGNDIIYNSSETITIGSPLSLDESGLLILANNISGKLEISFDQEEKRKLSLVNLNGQLIREVSSYTRSTSFEDLEPGIYILLIETSGDLIKKKMMVR